MHGRFRGPSDDYILNGNWHKCACGARWSDSDGGPCHVKCEDCGELIDSDEVNEDCLCPDCTPIPCSICGEKYIKEDFVIEGVCVDCCPDTDYLVMLIESPLEVVAERMDDEPLYASVIKARLDGEPIPEKAQQVYDLARKKEVS